MATSSFYHDNLFRQYPFQFWANDPLNFPTEILVGAKIIFSYDSPCTKFPAVFLSGLSSVSNAPFGDAVQFIFWIEYSDTVRNEVRINVPKTTGMFETVVSKISLIGGAMEGSEDTVTFRLTIGDLSVLPPLSVGQVYFTSLNKYFEPTCLFWLRHRGVNKVSLINENRNRLDLDEDDLSLPLKMATYKGAKYWYADSYIIDTPLLLHNGFNCQMVASRNDNKFYVLAVAGAGAGPVEGFPLLGSTLYDGGGVIIETVDEDDKVRPDGLPHNDQILYAINGLPGPEIHAGESRTVWFHKDSHDSHTVVMAAASLGGKSC